MSSLQVAQGLLACPHCGGPLAAHGRAWHCPVGHSFDVAKQGYLNLAGGPEPANADTAAMLDARARVQDSGLFGFVEQALDDAAGPAEGGTVLEVGAGTGHYLAGLVERRPTARGLALDVSRAAARRAARAHPRIASVVADVWRGLPVLDAAVEVLLCVFAPRNADEFARVLAPTGRVLVVTPSARHLAELRRDYGLLGIEHDKHDRLLDTLGARLRHRASTTHDTVATLEPAMIDDLIGMGPNAFHAPPPARAAERVTLSIRLDVFVKA